MERAIVGFHRDEAGDWVAELDCGHGRHVRHRPPWEVRPWVMRPEGRESRLGLRIECPKCDGVTTQPLDGRGAGTTGKGISHGTGDPAG